MAVKQTDTEAILSFGNSTVRVLKHGATILSWKIDGKEQLWLSDKAVLDGTKAVRGGIPLVFPVFGKATDGPLAKLPQHGFARTHAWELLGQTKESPLTVQFGLGPENISQESKDQWPYDFTLVYTVTVAEKTLTTALSVENPGSQEFEFNVLFHTYFKIPSIDDVSVTGLKLAPVHDKVSSSFYQAEGDSVQFSSEVDRVYSDIPASTTLAIHSPNPQVSIERSNLPDVVVWNPWTDKAAGMGDFYPKDGFKNMVCVETGSVSANVKLAPGKSWEGSQTIKAHL